MTNSKYIDIYFNCFPAYFESSWFSHREHFKQLINYERVDKQQIANAISVLEFSWKERACQSDFFLYDKDKTEEDLKIDYMLLTWDVLFPNQILSPQQLEQLKLMTVMILEHESKENQIKSVHIDDIIWKLEEEENWSNLSRYDLLYMRQEIGRQKIELEYFVPELWFFKLRSKAEPTSLEEQIRMSK